MSTQQSLDSTADDQYDLAEALSMYDDCNFETTESDRHCPGVSPRSFPTEIGYDLPLEQMPAEPARMLIDAFGSPAYTLVRLFGDHDENGNEAFFERMIDKQAYFQVDVHYIIPPEADYDHASRYLIFEYSAFGDGEIEERPHNEQTGYYYGKHTDAHETAHTLLFDSHDDWRLGRLHSTSAIADDTIVRAETEGKLAHDRVVDFAAYRK